MIEKRIDDRGRLIRFDGFPREGFAFLKALKRNNRREWFQPRKADYEELLVRPMRALIVELADRLGPKVPGMPFDPRRAVYRIYRDVRFSEDKSPYKTHIAAHVSYPSGPGFYLHLAPGDVWAGGGLYMLTPEQLKRIRLRIHDDPDRFRKLVGSPAIRKMGGLQGEPLKRPPKGWANDLPHLDLLKWKQFYSGGDIPERAALRRDFVKAVVEKMTPLVPLVRWLHETI